MKMKKFIPVLAALCLGAAAVAGCTAEEDNIPAEKYDELNAMLAKDYSQIVLTVENTYGTDTLESVYTINYTNGGMTVEYSVERFAELSLGTAAQLKTTVTGEAKIEGDEITYIDGEKVDLTAVIQSGGINFKKEYFKNAELTDMTFDADVKNPQGFIGSEITCTNMTVSATYLYFFYSINISYTSQSGNYVKYSYKFTV